MEFSKFGSEILKIAIEKENDHIVQLIVNKIIKLIEEGNDDENDSINYMMLLPFIISLKLPELCDNDYRYSHLITKYTVSYVRLLYWIPLVCPLKIWKILHFMHIQTFFILRNQIIIILIN